MDDVISRQALLDKFEPWLKVKDYNDGELNMLKAILYEIRFMPSAQPEIIYCKDCVKHNKRIGDYVEKSDGTYDWIWKDQACPLAEFRGKAHGHEFDYQFCAYAERRTE